MFSATLFLSYASMWLLALAEFALLLLVYRHFGTLTLAGGAGLDARGLPIGEAAPDVYGVTADGEEIVWHATPQATHLLAFVSPDCGPCVELMPHLNRLGLNKAPLDVTLVVRGPEEFARRLKDKFSCPWLCVADNRSITYQRYGVEGTPFIFVIGPDGQIRAKGVCNDDAKLRRLLTTAGFQISLPLLPDPRRAAPRAAGSGKGL